MKTRRFTQNFLHSRIAAALATTLALASETNGESRFHLLSTKCETEAESGADTTPQSPPLTVDDPATPGCNKWEINVLVDSDITPSQRNLELPLLDVNYGIGDNVQLKYEVPYISARAQDTTTSAIGESKVGVKYMFFEDEKSKLQFAIYPQLTFLKASTDAVGNETENSGTLTTLPVLMSVKLRDIPSGEIKLSSNLAYNISSKPSLPDSISASIGLGAPVTDHMAVMSELTTEQAMKAIQDETRDQLLKVDLGLVGTINSRFLLFGAVGHSLYSSDGLGHTYGLVGFKLYLDGYKSESKHFASNSDSLRGMAL